MKYRQGMTDRECADALGRTLDEVKYQVRVILKRLRRECAE